MSDLEESVIEVNGMVSSDVATAPNLSNPPINPSNQGIKETNDD
jgi:hypothetical protein